MKKNAFINYFHFILRIININWLIVILINVLFIIETFINSIVMAEISKYLIDNVFVSQRLDNLRYIIPIYIMCYFLGLGIELISTYMLIKWKIEIDYQLKNNFYKKMTEVKYEYLERVTSSELFYRMFEDGSYISGYAYIIFIIIPSSLICASFILVTLFSWSVPLSMYTLVLVVAELVNLRIIRKPIERISTKQKRINQFIVNFILEKLEFIDQTKAGNFKEWWIEKVRTEFQHANKITRENQYKNTLLSKIVTFFQEFWTVGFLILGGYLSANNICTVGLFFSFQSLINHLLLPLNKIFNGIFLFQETKVSFARYKEYYDLPIEEVGGKPFKFNYSLEIRNIDFSYNTNSHKIFNNFSLYMKKNELIGIKGESGCGKTTLLKLCTRLLEVKRGSICIDGVDIKDVDIASFRENFNFMLQTSVIFEDTLRNNITLGKETNKEDIDEVIEKCHLAEVVKKLPNNIDTLVGKGGINFSKGEIQRIALARILLRKPSIIWLDEPTASLDEETEMYIIDTIVTIKNEMSCLVVVNTHSKNLLKYVDRIVIL